MVANDSLLANQLVDISVQRGVRRYSQLQVRMYSYMSYSCSFIKHVYACTQASQLYSYLATQNQALHNIDSIAITNQLHDSLLRRLVVLIHAWPYPCTILLNTQLASYMLGGYSQLLQLQLIFNIVTHMRIYMHRQLQLSKQLQLVMYIVIYSLRVYNYIYVLVNYAFNPLNILSTAEKLAIAKHLCSKLATQLAIQLYVYSYR